MNSIAFNPQIDSYLPLLIFGGGALLFMGISLSISALLRPSKPTQPKLEVYESGEDTLGNAQAGFNIRYFQIALLFILFEVDIILLFPYVIKAAEPNFLSANPLITIQLLFFFLLLVLGLWYPWSKGNLEWEKGTPDQLVSPSSVPDAVYEKRTAALKIHNKHRGNSQE